MGGSSLLNMTLWEGLLDLDGLEEKDKEVLELDRSGKSIDIDI